MSSTADDIAARLRALPQAHHDPMIYGIAVALDRGNTLGDVLVGAVAEYSNDAAQLRKVAADALAQHGVPAMIVRADADEFARLTRERDALVDFAARADAADGDLIRRLCAEVGEYVDRVATLTRERDAARADGAREMRERAAAEAMRGNGGVTHAELATIHAVAAKSLAGALDTPEARIAYLLEAHPHAGACELVAWLIRALPIVEVPA